MEYVIASGLFVAAACVVLGVLFLFRSKWDPDAASLEKRLKRFAQNDNENRSINIRRNRLLSDVPGLHAVLSRMSLMHRLDLLVWQANAKLPLGVFLLLSGLIFLITFLILNLMTRGYLIPGIVAIILGTAPFCYLYINKRRRIAKFERQLPDALDLMARSLKAGHAFSGGLQMVAQEFGDPIGPEFMRIVNEINFGAPVEQALKNMNDRVDVPDLKFFTVSVIIQRESGGNLAEILESIARIIRERFKLLGRIKALSAEGKLSAIILTALPFLIVLVLSFVNPGYFPMLLEDVVGKVMVVIALCMIGVGIYAMKKMINIRV